MKNEAKRARLGALPRALLLALALGIAGCAGDPASKPAPHPSSSSTGVDAEAENAARVDDDAGNAAGVDDAGEAPDIGASVITLAPEGEPEPTRPPTLVDIGAVDGLRDRFEAASGKTRLVLLLSPT